jgi:hypothetical protein
MHYMDMFCISVSDGINKNKVSGQVYFERTFYNGKMTIEMSIYPEPTFTEEDEDNSIGTLILSDELRSKLIHFLEGKINQEGK